MRILYVSQYYPPEACAPAARVDELSRHWAAQGHDVTVLTAFAQHPVGIKAPGDRGKLLRVETIGGVRVVRTYIYATANCGMLRRMVSYASFMLSAMIIGWAKTGKPDVVIATSPQLLCGLAGYVLARLRHVPFVFEVRDLWPESILAVEAMRENLVVRALKRLSAFFYAHCDRIVTVGEGYRQGIHARYGVALEKIDVVANGIDRELFQPVANAESTRRELGWDDRFVVLYVGTHGMAHSLANLLEAAKVLADDPGKLFVLVGEGAEKEQLKALAARWKLTNVEFHDQQPRERIAEIYAAGDFGIVMLRNSSLFQEVLPSKIFEYLAMEKPLVVSVNGEARRLVETADAGWYVPPGNVNALVAAIRGAAADRKRLAEMGRRGRSYVLAHHDRSALADRYLEILRSLLKTTKTTEVFAPPTVFNSLATRDQN